MTDFNSFAQFLKEDLKRDMDSKPHQFKEAVQSIADKLHKKLDIAKEHLISNGIAAFEKEDKEKLSHLNVIEDSKKNVKDKIGDLVSSLDEMLKKTEFMDEAIRTIKEESINKLLMLRKGELLFKIGRKFELKVDGKSRIDLGWKNPQNKNFSKVEDGDDTKLNIYGNSCYNYYQTNVEFTDEDVEVEFLTNGYEASNYFYFGVRNETTDVNNNCMCCTPASVTYFRPSGYVCFNGTGITENKLTFNNSSRSDVKIRIKMLLSDASNKRVYFEVNENGESGPYALKGERFIITSGSCNNCTGFIKIESALLV